MKKLLLFLLLLSVTEIGTSLLAQDANSTDLTKEELLRRFLYQNNLMPQERVHVMTDRNHYLSGDTIWMRAFLVDGLYKKPVHYSRFLYVELRDENDALACRVKLHEQPEKGERGQHQPESRFGKRQQHQPHPHQLVNDHLAGVLALQQLFGARGRQRPQHEERGQQQTAQPR